MDFDSPMFLASDQGSSKKRVAIESIPNATRPGCKITLEDAHQFWRDGNLGYKLHAGQLSIRKVIREMSDPLIDQFVLLCGRRFGKSTLGVTLALEDCLKNDQVNVYIIGPSIEQTRGIVSQHIEKIAADAPDGLIRELKTELMWQVGTSRLIVSGFKSRTGDRTRGFSAYNIYIEETREFDPDDYERVMTGVLEPMLATSDSAKVIHLTTPPDDPEHPFVTLTVEKARSQGVLFERTIFDNPIFTPEWRDQIIQRAGGLHSPQCQREWLAKIVRDKRKVIIPTFDKTRHAVEFQIPVEARWITMLDNGGTIDKTVAIIAAYNHLTDDLHCVAEVVFPPNTPTKEKLEQIEYAERLYCSHFPPYRVGDVTGELRADLASEHKFTLDTPIKANRDMGIQEVIDGFSNDRITVHPRCDFLTKSLQSARLAKSGDFERTEVYGHADAIAALIYGYRSRHKAAINSFGQRMFADYESKVDHKKSFVGFIDQHLLTPACIVAISEQGKLLLFKGYKGPREHRLSFLKEALQNLRSPEVAILSGSLDVATIAEIEIFLGKMVSGIKRIEAASARSMLFEALQSCTIDTGSCTDLTSPIMQFKASPDIKSEQIDALSLSMCLYYAHERRQRYLKTGFLLKPEVAKTYRKQPPSTVCLGIYLEETSGTFYCAMKWPLSGLDILWVDAFQTPHISALMDYIITQGYSVAKVVCSSQTIDSIQLEIRRVLSTSIAPIERDPSTKEIVSSYLSGREYFSDNPNLSEVKEEVLLYPDSSGSSGYLIAGHYVNKIMPSAH